MGCGASKAAPRVPPGTAPACQTGSCGFMVNQNPAYRANKPVIDHSHCCTACRTSGGKAHGVWCQKASAKVPEGLVVISIGHAVTWKEAEQMANSQADGLPNREELEASKVTAGDGVDLWMPVCRSDGREGDYCQIGNHPFNRNRYISHIDAFGMPKWFTNTTPAPWRPTTYFFAKAPGDPHAKEIADVKQQIVAAAQRGDFAQVKELAIRGQGLAEHHESNEVANVVVYATIIA